MLLGWASRLLPAVPHIVRDYSGARRALLAAAFWQERSRYVTDISATALQLLIPARSLSSSTQDAHPYQQPAPFVRSWQHVVLRPAETATKAPSCMAQHGRRFACTARVLDGKAIAAEWTAELSHEVERLKSVLHRPPGLAVVLVGERADSEVYVSRKREACSKVGIHETVLRLPEHVSQRDLERAVRGVCEDDDVDGVLVQLPLPRHLDEAAIMEAIDPVKDVDGFHPLNMGRMLARGVPPRFIPCTSLGCMELISRAGIEVAGKTCVVVGDSNIVGTPIAALLRDAGAAFVTVCHRISFRDLFDDSHAVQAMRAAAEVCLPTLPGPLSFSAMLQHRRTATAVPHAAPSPAASHQTPQPAGSAQPSGSVSRGAHDSAGIGGVNAAAGAQTMQVGNNNSAVPHHAGPHETPQHASHAEPGHRSDGGQHTSHHHSNTSKQSSAPGGMDAVHDRFAAQHDDAGKHGTDNEHEGIGLDVLPQITRMADILIVAVGHAELVTADWVKPGAVVIDIGINVQRDASRHSDATSSHNGRRDGGKHGGRKGGGGVRILGDVAYDDVSHIASAITPVPGGIGPMTIASVVHNVVQAAKYKVGDMQW